MRDEVDHVTNIGRVGDSFEHITFVSICIQIYTLGDLLEPNSREISRRAFFYFLAVDLWSCENFITISCVVGILIPEDEPADSIGNIARFAYTWTLIHSKYLPKVFEVIRSDDFNEFCFVFGHTLEQFFQITKLLTIGLAVSFDLFEHSL